MEEGAVIRQNFTQDVPTLSVEELQRLQSDYPYFQAVRFLYLKKLRCDFPERYPQALQENALYAGDRKVLFTLLEGAEQTWNGLYPDEKEKPETDAFGLIDSFLASRSSELGRETELYPEASYRFDDAETPAAAPAENSFALVDAFLDASPEEKEPQAPVIAVAEKPENEDSDELQDEEFLTESLAKIYIKQRRYAKALEIIRKLSLKYPEKNIYFADQIRFLEKLIINIKPE